MKRILLTLLLCLTYAACGDKPGKAVGTPTSTPTATPSPSSMAVITDLLLVNGNTGGTQPADGGSLPEGTQMNVRAKVNSGAKSVTFVFVPGGTEIQNVVSGGYAKSNGVKATAGSYVVTATPWTSTNATGTKGQSVRATYTITGAGTPTPPPTVTPSPSTTPTPPVTPSPTSTATPTPTSTPSPTQTPSSSPTPSPSASPTSSPTPSVTPTVTPPPSPTPSPSPSSTPASLVTVTVNWQATKDYSYKIFYGKDATANDMQVDGGIAFQDGPMCVTIGNLEANTNYWFSDVAIYYQTASPKLSPTPYRTKPASNQQLTLP